MPKVIAVDNYGRDTVSDELVADCPNRLTAIDMARRLNDESGLNASKFYRVVADDYELYKWEP